ncbi:MAG: LapA family protein [Ktedonobacteraceae bacterium]
MFYIALLFLILLGGTALVIIYQNFLTLLSGEHLLFFTWHLPGIPVLLLCFFAAFLGGLLLYVFSAFAARRDAREIKDLRAHIADFEKMREKVPSGALMMNVVPPVVPIPGFSTTGPLQQWPSPTSSRSNLSVPGSLPKGPSLSSVLPNGSSPSVLPYVPSSAGQFPPFPPQNELRPPLPRQ